MATKVAMSYAMSGGQNRGSTLSGGEFKLAFMGSKVYSQVSHIILNCQRHIIVNYQRSMREDISGAKAAIRETIPCPTWGFDLRVFLKYPIGSSVFTSTNFL